MSYSKRIFICVNPVGGSLERWRMDYERDLWEREFSVIQKACALNGEMFLHTMTYVVDYWSLHPMEIGREIIDIELIPPEKPQALNDKDGK